MSLMISPPARAPKPAGAGVHPRGLRAYGLAVALVAAVAAVSRVLLGQVELANIVMLFPLVVLFAAVRLGRGPAVLSALLSVALFDFFLVPPHFTLAISDLQYLITLAVLLVVALTTAELAAGLRLQRDRAEQREARARVLYEAARELSAALTVGQIGELCHRFAAECLAAEAVLLLPDGKGQLQALAPRGAELSASDLERARTVYAGARAEGEAGGGALLEPPPAGGVRLLPLRAPAAVRGILRVFAAEAGAAAADDWQQTLETFTTLVAISVERIHYVEVASAVELEMASERLRNSMLAALSHDLRTPLTAMLGLAESLPLAGPLSGAQQEIADAIRDEALRTGSLVNNLLEMARLQSGGVRLRREWQPLEEVVGAALRARSHVLRQHRLRLDLPDHIPLVWIDAVLIERVFCNLLENAARMTPAGGQIEISAAVDGEAMLIRVADDGPGLAAAQLQAPFGRFGRGVASAPHARSGLGLAIVQAIVEAHGGTVEGSNRASGGACFTLRLPLGTPPQLDPEQP